MAKLDVKMQTHALVFIQDLAIIMLVGLLGITNAIASNRVVNLVVSYKTVNFSGKYSKAIAVNNQIPAPTLHFKEGDKVTIHVYNQLNKETAIHWHGVLVPWQMDGVLGINQKGIPPGGVFHYQFTLKQAGTYWYHAHAGLQEQQGLYGAFLIDPHNHPSYQYTKDFVMVLSDWTDTDPDRILANLKVTGDYNSPKFPLQPSLLKFIYDYRKACTAERQKLIADYQMMQQMRMNIYDLSDVAYDAFLLNGQSKFKPWIAAVKVGDVVRLRFIGASGSTIFHVKIPYTTMQVVHVDGNDVQPFTVNDFTIAPGETYDVLVKIQKNHPYIIYAESIDTIGAVYGALLSSAHQVVNFRNVTPFPEPLPVTREMMSLMSGPKIMAKSMPMQHVMPMHQAMSMHEAMPNHTMKMSMPTEPTVIGDSIIRSNPASYITSLGTKYEHLIEAVKTNNPNKAITGIIKMELFGYMDRFIWFINGVPEYNARPIVLVPGKRYRIIFTNMSMMHHPMHVHGHWFILRKGNGAYDPLLHTIDVPPGATITADVDTDASGQWIFHCHFLYHMLTGMARTLQYSTLIEIINDEAKPQNIIKKTPYINRPIVRVDALKPIDVSLVKYPMAHLNTMWFATFLDIGINPVTNFQKVTFKSLYGADYNKLELFTNEAEVNKWKIENADLDIFYWHLLDQFWAVKGGVNYFYRPAKIPYWQLGFGLEGLMPYFIDTDIRGYFYRGSIKLDMQLSRDTQITNNFFIRVEIRSILASKTVKQATIGSALNQMQYTLRPYYRLMPGLNIFTEFEYEQDYGAFKKLQADARNSSSAKTLTFGMAMFF